MSPLLLMVGWLAGCGGDPAETPPAATPTQPIQTPDEGATRQAPAETSQVRSDRFELEETGWTAANISQLSPRVPVNQGVTPFPLEATPEIETTLTRLGAVVDQYASDPENPWAIGHGLLARGEGFRLSDGQDAIDALFSTYAEELVLGEQRLVRFPNAIGNIRVEPHKGQLLKVLTEIGVSPDRMVTVQGKPHPISDLYRGTLMESYLDPARNHSSFSSTDDLAWTLQGLTAWTPPDDELRWQAIDGTPMSLDDFATFNVTVLVHESQFMFDAMQAGASFDKRGQGIFKYTCGGAHLLQGALYAVGRGHSTELARKAVLGQIPLMFYRLPIELSIYDTAMQQHPDKALILLVQRLKFTGHFLETMHKLAAMGFYRPTETQQKTLTGVAQQVVLSTQAIAQLGAFDEALTIRQSNEQLYLDIVGDSAHALHALELALGRAKVLY